MEKESRPPEQPQLYRSCSSSIQAHPFNLSFNSLTYTIKTSQQWPKRIVHHHKIRLSGSHQKVLLNSISGEATEGEILAVLGPSGSGKSTLMDALANQMSKENFKGSIRLNGEVLDSKLLKSVSAYVKQDDILFPMLTVEETLLFAAQFKLAKSLSYSKKKARVQELIEQLCLQGARDTMIGDEGHRGVSGGERRRVSIGTNIIHNPIILFLDEPTSGLDSTNALMVVKVLKSIALSGSIVIMTVHQPSSRILKFFDKLMFLSRGQTMYSGSLARLPEFFQHCGYPVPQNENTAEFALDLILQLEESPMGTKLLAEFNKTWQDQMNIRSEITACANSKKLSPILALRGNTSKSKLTFDHHTPTSFPAHANPIWIETIILAKRAITNSTRIPELYGLQFISVILAGVMLGTIFFRLDLSLIGAQERTSFFASVITTTFFICAESLPTLFAEKQIINHEINSGAFRRASFVISQTLTSLPSLILLSITLAATTFWPVGLSGGAAGFLTFSLFIFSAFWAGQSLVAFVAAVINNVMSGYAVIVSVMANFLLFSGFFIRRDRIPPYWVWFHYVSPVKYPYQGVLLSEFDGERCFVKGVEMFDATPLLAVSRQVKAELLDSIGRVLAGATDGNLTVGECVMRGMTVLTELGVDDLGKWQCFWITIGWGVSFRILLYLASAFCGREKK